MTAKGPASPERGPAGEYVRGGWLAGLDDGLAWDNSPPLGSPPAGLNSPAAPARPTFKAALADGRQRGEGIKAA